LRKKHVTPPKTPIFPSFLTILPLSTAFASRLERLPFFAGKRGILGRPRNRNPVVYRVAKKYRLRSARPRSFRWLCGSKDVLEIREGELLLKWATAERLKVLDKPRAQPTLP
jgi:hypothetical protein